MTRRTRAGSFTRMAISALSALGLAGCAGMPASDPLQVTVAGVESMQGEGMELRMLVKLRIQNPNDAAVPFKGASVRMDVQRRTFATGVMNEGGTLPALGEAVVQVPVTVSAWSIIRQVMGAMDDQATNSIQYSMSGKLHTGGLGGLRFGTAGEMEAPAAWRTR